MTSWQLAGMLTVVAGAACGYPGKTCSSDSDCGDGAYCYTELSICVSSGDTGPGPSDTGPGPSDAGAPACASTSECSATGRICVSGRCVPCAQRADCSSNGYPASSTCSADGKCFANTCSNNPGCIGGSLQCGTDSTAPTRLTASLSTIIRGSSSTLSVDGGSLGTGATWQWYAGSCGGTPAGTGATIAASPVTDTAYFVRAVGTCNTTDCVSATVKVCTPTSCVAQGKNCNSISDGCGGTLDCGSCISPKTCLPTNVCGCDWNARPSPKNSPYIPAIPHSPPLSSYDYTTIPDEVRDSQTCLIWRRNSQGYYDSTHFFRYYLYGDLVSAQQSCANNGFRLPTRTELESILDDTGSLKINTTAFTNTTYGPYWTSTPSATDSSKAWAVDFKWDQSYEIVTGSGGTAAYLRCVR